jgi:hypothetical protein
LLPEYTGQRFFNQHCLAGRECCGAYPLVQMRRCDYHHRIDLRITQHIQIFAIVTHVVLTGEGRPTPGLLTHGIEFSAVDIVHEVTSITHVFTQANSPNRTVFMKYPLESW